MALQRMLMNGFYVCIEHVSMSRYVRVSGMSTRNQHVLSFVMHVFLGPFWRIAFKLCPQNINTSPRNETLIPLICFPWMCACARCFTLDPRYGCFRRRNSSCFRDNCTRWMSVKDRFERLPRGCYLHFRSPCLRSVSLVLSVIRQRYQDALLYLVTAMRVFRPVDDFMFT